MDTDSAQLLKLQSEVLEAVACGEALVAIADMLCRRAEAMAPGVICSILSVDDNRCLHPLASPSLPLAYASAIDGLPAGPKTGSCGTAVHINAEVVVTDIDSDPLWEAYRGLTQPLGLKACWSSPIRDRAGKVLATFAFYYCTPRAPNDLERAIVQTCVHLCAVAIEHQLAQERSYRLAYFDALTGLPNRGHFNEILSRAIALAEPFGLLLIDIDHLKVVNDTIGHAYGDLLIRTVAERIADSHPSLRACRLGGDEFAILVDHCADKAQLEHAAHLVLNAVSGLIETDAETIDPHVTVGGALFSADGDDAATLSQNADFALYHAKETQRGGYVQFTPTLRTATVERANMIRSVDEALTDRRVLAHYQPIVRIDTGEIVGVEALARMRMPDGRIASAGEFHVALADPRIAWQLTGQMLTQVAADIRHWLDLGIPFQHVGINVTTGDFIRGDLERRIVETFEATRVPLHHLILEVNEAVFMNGADRTVPHAVRALRQRGLLVALDDFGTGFASLTHLLSFPVDVIKVDKSFVDRLGTDSPSDVIVGAINDIARRLGIKLVAEGIEREEQARALSDFGCNLGQGFLYSRPVSAEDATRLLAMFAQRPADVTAPKRQRA